MAGNGGLTRIILPVAPSNMLSLAFNHFKVLEEALIEEGAGTNASKSRDLSTTHFSAF